MKRIYILVTLFTLLAVACDEVTEEPEDEKKTIRTIDTPTDSIVPTTEMAHFEEVDYTPTANGEVRYHTYYSLSYMEEHEQAEWVFYILTPAMVNGTTERKDNFREDPLISTTSATLSDYKGSGYDRGHLAPAKAMSLNETSMSESFYMSNMSPQSPSCNRGKWKSLETKVREWVNKHDTLYVATGAILKDSLGSIGSNNVTIPSYYYKVILCPTPHLKMIAFILPNEKMDLSIDNYITSVDSVESATGIDFFAILPDSIEQELESTSHYSSW